MHANQHVLGIEGGGTKTEWLLLSGAGQILRQGSLPAANLRLIRDITLEAMFRVLPAEVTHVGAFLAGCVNEADRMRLEALVRKVWPHAQIAVGSDRDSGFATAFGDGDGVAVIAGTGSAVTGRKNGRLEKAAGWGQLLGDKGGGYNLAVQALRFVLSNYDIDHHVDDIGASILRTLGLNRLEELVSWAAEADKMSVAKLAPVVFAAAKAGQHDMLEAVQAGARILAEFTRAVALRLDLPSPEVRLLGGLFVHHPEYADLLKDFLSELLPGARVAICERSGAFGAAWLAERHLPIALASATQDKTDYRELASAATEQRNPRSEKLDELSTLELVDLFVAEENYVTQALATVRTPLAAAIELIATALNHGGRLFYIGAGTSGRLGVLDASEIPPTFSAPPDLVQGLIAGGVRALYSAVEGAEDQPEAGAYAVVERGVTPRDIVCGLAASGRTPFVLGALTHARDLGARTILLTCNPARNRSTPAWEVEIDLPTGPELVTGSTRLKAGTATKVALNILSTGAMIRLGKVRGNLMIDVHVSNIKLRDRAVRLVSQACGCTYGEAQVWLEKNDWQVRSTILKKSP